MISPSSLALARWRHTQDSSMSAFQSTAYLLVSHGSRDPRPQTAMNRLAHLVREELLERRHQIGSDSSPSPRRPMGQHPRRGPTQADGDAGVWTPLVGTSCLELGVLPLHQQIFDFSQRAQAAGMKRVRIIPLFLLKGVHVMDDIPAEVEQARLQIEGKVILEICPYLGSHPGLKKLLKQRIQDAAADAWLLLSHGSRRPGGNYAIERLARELQAETAFWSVAPQLEDQVVHMMQAGHQRLTILPYFLFSGGITDTVTRVTEDLAERFPRVDMRLLAPLGATPAIAKLITDLAIRGSSGGSLSTLPMSLTALRY